MPLDVKEFIIQAKFADDDEGSSETAKAAAQKQATDYKLLKEELISECMDRIEELLRKRDRR
ncbi:DUF5908 family protein [Dawidia soli]|uniref:Uncharacterized protein n=1 Tax=Dawidia soli TaxID=2782352 RepID=A0AAP2GD38_9BACT|nr:DUF5908 family protein [Dawidia soli]MBT1686944.1 hypothetical protein [Dawidia soli]